MEQISEELKARFPRPDFPEHEKWAFFVGGAGACSSPCEVLESPSGPEYRIFRFREVPRFDIRCLPIQHVSYFENYNGEMDPGPLGETYHIVQRLEAPPGYIAVVEGTTKPKPRTPVEPVPDNEDIRCQDAIMGALEKEPRMTLSALKRKTHAHRFGSRWDKALQDLEQDGELRLNTERGLTDRPRVWVTLTETAPSGDGACTSK